jgi:hypothetical protein
MSRSILTVLAAGFVAVSGAQAQLTKIFVASFGNDGNDGSRGSPKRNFQAAHNAVAAGGQIVVLDTAGYGQLTITKSLAVTVPPGVNGFVTVTGTNDAITVAAGEGSEVSLRGLIIEGGGNRQSTGNGPGFGIHVTSVGWLSVEDCTIRNFLDALPFTSTNFGARLTVYNTTVRNCRYGFDVQGVGSGGLSPAAITGCRLDNLGDAVFATGDVNVNLADCVIAHCDTGIHFATTSGFTFVAASGCKFSDVSNPVVGSNFGTYKIAASYGNNTAAFSSNVFNESLSLK